MIEGVVSRSGICRYRCKMGIQSHQGMDIWVQAAYNSNYWFSYNATIGRFYSG